jgi:DNA-binding transcriptional LysR family regulator
MMTPGFSELNAAAAIATRKSFRAAANDLGISASALSHAVASLESRLGVRLFNRTTRSVSLTLAGEQFLARVKPAMHEIANAMHEVNEQRETPAGLIRINTSEGAGEQIMAPIVTDFLRRYGEVQLEIVTQGRLVDIVAEGFDAGVRLAELVPRDMISIPIGKTQQHVVVGASSYFATRTPPRSPSDLKEHACVRHRLPSGSIYRWEFEKRGQAVSVDINGRLTLDSDRLVLRAALAGAGLAYVSESSAREALAEGRLVQVLNDWTPPYPGLCLYYPSHRHVAAAMRAFTDMIREWAVNDRLPRVSVMRPDSKAVSSR